MTEGGGESWQSFKEGLYQFGAQKPEACHICGCTAPQPTPTPKPGIYKIDAEYLGDGGVVTDIFKNGPDPLPCLQAEYDKAYKLCTTEPVYSRWRNADVKWGQYLLDDCITAKYFLGDKDDMKWVEGNHVSWTPAWRSEQICFDYGPQRGGRVVENVHFGEGCSYKSGYWYVDENCNSVIPEEGDEIFEAGTLYWKSSPISLLWDNDTDINDGLYLSQFPLEKGQDGDWYVWKASGKAPLLVYDPQHKGIIKSADQLFGHWTFGGKKLASISTGLNRLTSQAAQRWENGFEALSTLDANDDGKISGAELKPLALWFDDNRDGISQPGEVLPVEDTGLNTLYYQPDHKGTEGSLIAKIGFERQRDNGTITKGSSIDWFAASAKSKAELINKFILDTPSDKLGSLEQSSHLSLPAKEITTDDKQTKKNANTTDNISGVWRWKSDNLTVEGASQSQGILSFKDLNNGTITGHSSTTSEIIHSKVKWAIGMFTLRGKKYTNDAGQTGISFALLPDGKNSSNVSSEAILSADGKVLSGKTIVIIHRGAKSSTVTYTWVGQRVYSVD